MMIGFFQSKILLPHENYTDEQLDMILTHELIHKKHHDLFFKLLLLFVHAIYWFNPFIYYMTFQINYIMELFCDETVLKNQPISYRTIYSITILQTITNTISRKNIIFSTYFHGGKYQMKQRFYEIMNQNLKKKGTALFAFFLTFILFTTTLSAHGSTNNSFSNLSSFASLKNKQQLTNSNPIHILLIGMDTKNFEKRNSARADSILVASLIPEKQQIIFTSFLRDLYVKIPGQKKIN